MFITEVAPMAEKDSFLSQLKSVRVELRERVSRAHQVLQERETTLLSELQQLENQYRGEGVIEQIPELSRLIQQTVTSLKGNENKETFDQNVSLLDTRMLELEANLQTARDSMRRVELEWDEILEGILGRTGSIRVSGVSDYKEKVKPEIIATKRIKIRQQVARPITEDKPIRGLKNLGNTSFMNSVLQCLSHTLPLRQFYVSDEYLNSRRGDISDAFMNVMVELWDTTTCDSVDPYDLKKQVEAITSIFPGYDQHDAHEFMRFLLNRLHEEINRASVEGCKSPADNETLEEACARYLTWEDSRISELFGGMLRSEVCCSVCSVCYNQSTVYIPFMDIALPIPELSYSGTSNPAVHLTDCLNMLTTEDTLEEGESSYCKKCMGVTTATKRLSIAKLPIFLVIQLRRFIGNQERTKLLTPVKFDHILANGKTHTYSLYGIVSHSGSIYGGHYTAYCKYGTDWGCFDDTMTSVVSWEHVNEQEAYILFYEREE